VLNLESEYTEYSSLECILIAHKSQKDIHPKVPIRKVYLQFSVFV